MIRNILIVIGLPLAIGLAVAVPVGLTLGFKHWVFAGIAFGLTLPPGLLTLAIAAHLIRTSPLGRVLALFVGTFVRLAIGLGGGLVIFFAAGPDERTDKIAFWLWLLFAYLVTLTAETAVLARWRPSVPDAETHAA